jgi:hypothetical protein
MDTDVTSSGHNGRFRCHQGKTKTVALAASHWYRPLQQTRADSIQASSQTNVWARSKREKLSTQLVTEYVLALAADSVE